MVVKIYIDGDHIDWNTFGMIMETCWLAFTLTTRLNGLHINIYTNYKKIA